MKKYTLLPVLFFALTSILLFGCKKTDTDATISFPEQESMTQSVVETTAETVKETEKATEEATTLAPLDDKQTIINGVTVANLVEVTPDDLNTYGFAAFKCTLSGTYHFDETGEGSGNWKVYVLDKEWTDSYKKLSQNVSPVISGEGKTVVKKGQYIYLYGGTDAVSGYRFGIEMITK